MTETNRPDRRTRNRIDFLVDFRWLLVSIVAILTLILAFFIPNIQVDPTLKSVLVTSSDSFHEYDHFRKFFDDDEYVVVTVKSASGVPDPSILASVDQITKQLSRVDGIQEVLSLTNFKVYQKQGQKLSNQLFVESQGGQLTLPEQTKFENVRKAIPVSDLLLSKDHSTLGILLRIHEKWKFDHKTNERILSGVEEIVKSGLSAGSEYRIVGQAVLRQAILKYTLKTALIFGILCTVICLAVTGYVFRNITVTVMTMAILGLCVLWVIGIMAALNIPLNATTSLSFGLILITTLELVIHMVTRYNQFHQEIPDRILAVKQTVRYLARPFFICSATTAVGFGSCMITSIPMVFQLGLIMSLGVTISLCLAMILVPTVIISLKSMDLRVIDRESQDGASRLLEYVMDSIRNHYRFFTAVGFVAIVIMLSGVPLIRSDPQILHQLGEARPEVKDVRYVESNLASIHSVQLVLESKDGAFRKTPIWQKVAELEARLGDIPEVVSTDSLLSWLEYVRNIVSAQKDQTSDLFANPGILPQMLFVTSFTSDGKRLIRKHIDDEYNRLNITVRINNDPSVPVMDTINRIKSQAQEVMKDSASVSVTGELVVIAAQGDDLIRSEIESMFVAIAIISMLMMLQMNSVSFGLISLIPNVPPVATVFGIMGFMKIPLDGVTVFAATVAVGLAVDNTIQFVTQLKREIRLNPGMDVEACVFNAYRLAAKPMASWSIVTVLGFLAMLATPFQAAVSFGILVASAVFMGIFADLIFMQSMILTFPSIKNIIQRIVEKENLAERNAELTT